jgi:hypothetical protein
MLFPLQIFYQAAKMINDDKFIYARACSQLTSTCVHRWRSFREQAMRAPVAFVQGASNARKFPYYYLLFCLKFSLVSFCYTCQDPRLTTHGIGIWHTLRNKRPQSSISYIRIHGFGVMYETRDTVHMIDSRRLHSVASCSLSLNLDGGDPYTMLGRRIYT